MTNTRPGNRIYHYCKLNIGIEKILSDKQLLLSPIINTNDPRESKALLFGGKASRGTQMVDIFENNEEISKILREDCKMISFSTDNFKYHLFGYELSRMWAYYGDNHKGICIELDKDEFLEENKEVINTNHLRPVKYFKFNIKKIENPKWINYTRINSIGKKKYLQESFRKTHLNYLYFQKNYEWNSEEEIRLIHFSHNQANEYCSIKNSLRNIFVGVDFNDIYLPLIKNLCPDIDIYKLRYMNFRIVRNSKYGDR